MAKSLNAVAIVGMIGYDHRVGQIVDLKAVPAVQDDQFVL